MASTFSAFMQVLRPSSVRSIGLVTVHFGRVEMWATLTLHAFLADAGRAKILIITEGITFSTVMNKIAAFAALEEYRERDPQLKKDAARLRNRAGELAKERNAIAHDPVAPIGGLKGMALTYLRLRKLDPIPTEPVRDARELARDISAFADELADFAFRVHALCVPSVEPDENGRRITPWYPK